MQDFHEIFELDEAGNAGDLSEDEAAQSDASS